jgi:hypothetical protein
MWKQLTAFTSEDMRWGGGEGGILSTGRCLQQHVSVRRDDQVERGRWCHSVPASSVGAHATHESAERNTHTKTSRVLCGEYTTKACSFEESRAWSRCHVTVVWRRNRLRVDNLGVEGSDWRREIVEDFDVVV